MKKLFQCAIKLLLFATVTSHVSSVFAQGTAFTYQGQLMDAGSPANGNYDLKLTLFDAVTNGNSIAGPITNTAVAVNNGLFTTTTDFGEGVFTGNSYWLRIGVRTNGETAFVTLNPRQPVTPSPYAIFAGSASNLSGTISANQLPPGVLTNDNTGVDLTGSFFGNGAGLSNVNAGTLGGLAAGTFWQLGGNNVGGGQFIGSTNSQPVELWANGQRALRLEPDTTGSGSPNVIGGSVGNFMNAGGVIGGFIGGGGATNYNGVAYPNHVGAYYGSIVGGYANTVVAFANNAFIGGGDNNTGAGNEGVIGGGEYNRIKAAGDHSVIAGGINNTNSGEYDVIAGGQNNTASGTAAVVGGGQNNNAPGTNATVAGGSDNTAGGITSTVGGGGANSASGASSFVGGGALNSAEGASATIGGGVINIATGGSSTVGGGEYNTASGNNATVAGGYSNSATNSWAAVSGGYENTAGGDYSTVGGGQYNVAYEYSFVGGGLNNYASGTNSAVAGGDENFANGYGATVSGGEENSAGNTYDAVGGGAGNSAGGGYSTIPGGYGNSASGVYSFAAGNSAAAPYQGDFVWGDSENNIVEATGPDQFIIRAQGGVGIDWVNPTGDSLSIGGSTRMNNNIIYFREYPDQNHGLAYVGSGTTFAGISPNGPVLWGFSGGGLGTDQNNTETMALQWTTSGVTVNGTFNNNSDRNAKQDFAPVSATQILDKVAKLPITTWRYKTDAATPHIGPMAQDFYSAFTVGTDEKHIAPIDEGGVALAAIQGLNQKLEEARAENAELKQRLDALEKLVRNQKVHGNNTAR